MSNDDILHTLSTLRDFIRWGASRMSQAGVHFGHGNDNALDEAANLVLQALHLPPDCHTSYWQAALTGAEKNRLLHLFEQRIEQRIPAAYLTGQAWFMGLPFYVDERVIIPRSPLAELIEQRFSPWLAEPDEITSILDLCTGSGCIAIACAYVFPQADIDASDISAEALAVAQQNIEDHGLQDQVRAVQSDLFTELNGQQYDLIISNPPYVGQDEFDELPDEYSHEPELSLTGGDDGLDAVSEILRQATQYLNAGGLLIVEVGNTQELLSETYPDVPFLWLDFERGGDGVFLLTAEQLNEYQEYFS